MNKVQLTKAQREKIVGFKDVIIVRQYTSTLFELIYPSGNITMVIISILGIIRSPKYVVVNLVGEKIRFNVDQFLKFPSDASTLFP